MDGSILKSFAILFASVGIVFVVLMLLKRFSKRFTAQNNAVQMKILSKLALNAKSHLYVIEADGKTLLLGVTEKSISTLSELSDSQRVSSFNTARPKPKQKTNPEASDETISNQRDLSFVGFLKSSVGMNKQKI